MKMGKSGVVDTPLVVDLPQKRPPLLPKKVEDIQTLGYILTLCKWLCSFCPDQKPATNPHFFSKMNL